MNFCRLAVVFLAFDVFFAIFCVALACVIGIALCCCLPCIIAILYAVAGQVLIPSFGCLYFIPESSLSMLFGLLIRKVQQMQTSVFFQDIGLNKAWLMGKRTLKVLEQ